MQAALHLAQGSSHSCSVHSVASREGEKDRHHIPPVAGAGPAACANWRSGQGRVALRREGGGTEVPSVSSGQAAMVSWFTPKHQKLVLSCYPPRSAERKPNPSELARLLYYASTRASKLPKVALFLERRTLRDIRKSRYGNAQVGLAIVRALIEKCDRELNIYAMNVLHIFNAVLQCRDSSLMESSQACFESFCAHHDGSNINTDAVFLQEYQKCVRNWAQVATAQKRNESSYSNDTVLGLRMIHAMCASAALDAIDTREQLHIIIPVILKALHTENDEELWEWQHRSQIKRRASVPSMERRFSASTVRTGNISRTDGDDSDHQSAEYNRQESAIAAMGCMRVILEANNAMRTRDTTSCIIDCIISAKPPAMEQWAAALIEIVSRWTPLTIRFTILITCIDKLEQTPMENIESKTHMTTIISKLLSSNVNFMGLSVMDILESLLMQITKYLRVHKASSHIIPPLVHEIVICIGNLATHIYYSDQISDMCSNVMFRIRAAPLEAASGIAKDDSEKSSVIEGFSSGMAKIVGFHIIREILIVANERGTPSGGSRNHVEMSMWEGTAQHILDEDHCARESYFDAFATFLEYEARETVAAMKMGDTSPTDAFLAELHLALYDNALYTTEPDEYQRIVYVLTTLVLKLGLYEIARGLPMVFTLQEQALMVKMSLQKRVTLLSLVGLYLQSIAQALHLPFMESKVEEEIERRQERYLWDEDMAFPVTYRPQDASNPLHQPAIPNGHKRASMSDRETDNGGTVRIFDRGMVVHWMAEEMSSFPAKFEERLTMQWDREEVLASTSSPAAHFADSISADNFEGFGKSRSMLALNALVGARSTRAAEKDLARKVYEGTNGNGSLTKTSSSSTIPTTVDKLKRVLSASRRPDVNGGKDRPRRQSLRHASIESTRMDLPRSASNKSFHDTVSDVPPVPPLPQSHQREATAHAIDVDVLLKHMTPQGDQAPLQPPYEYM